MGQLLFSLLLGLSALSLAHAFDGEAFDDKTSLSRAPYQEISSPLRAPLDPPFLPPWPWPPAPPPPLPPFPPLPPPPAPPVPPPSLYYDSILKCWSRSYRYRECTTPGLIYEAGIYEQDSRTACRYDYSWGFYGNVLWVNRGCRASFWVRQKY